MSEIPKETLTTARPDWVKPLSVLAFIALLALVMFTLRHQLTDVHYRDIVRQIHAIPLSRLLLGLLATFASFLVLSSFDFLSLAYLKCRVATRQVLATSFIAFAIGNFLGFGLLTGGAIRARAYLNAGLEPKAITKLISLNSAAYFASMIVFGSLALLINMQELINLAPLSPGILKVIISAFLLVDLLLILAFIPGITRLLLLRWQIRLPSWRLALGYLSAGALDMGLSATVLWLLLPVGSVAFWPFVAIFTFATALGLVSQIPGGVGVFEAILLTSLNSSINAAEIASALVLYRLIYYVWPLLTATGLVVWYEVLGNMMKPLHRLFIGLAPRLLAMVASLVGVVLLQSGVTPTNLHAERLLKSGIPLFIVEASHLFGSVAGLALLLVTRGLLHRQNGAWLVAMTGAVVGALLALPKGIAVLELSLSLLLCLYLYMSRHLFTRHSNLLNSTLTFGWWLYIAGVLACCAWLIFFSYRDIDYSDRLWWQFAFDAHAPRSLRALMVIFVLTFAAGLWQLLRVPDIVKLKADPSDTKKALAIAMEQSNPDALLVAMGDKLLHFSEKGNGFVMYGKLGRSWIALFDPICPEKDQADLVWSFVDHVESHGGRAAFYEVRPEHLPLYLDAGMRTWKVGECAIVKLQDFDLAGPDRSRLRQTIKRGEREGLEFRIADRDELTGLFQTLEHISNEWLAAHNTREKSFSLGHFSFSYITVQPVALVSLHGEIVAFATLQATNSKYEVSLDLMRYLPSAPKSCMEYLFCRLLLSFKEQGYQRFSLGMAPMSGMSKHRLANRWHKLAQLVYVHGERFYNFQGLRAFKQKFDPEWEPRYLATTPGYLPIVALKDIAVLVSGSLKGVISK